MFLSFAIQWCFLARLTWWEFNWDIMEPVTYFITFGTAVLGYAYFVIQKREYTFPDLREAIMVKRMFKQYTKHNFDVDRYDLELLFCLLILFRYFELEEKIKKLDPLAIQHLTEEIEAEEEVRAAVKPAAA